jgi:hypothetical protein
MNFDTTHRSTDGQYMRCPSGMLLLPRGGMLMRREIISFIDKEIGSLWDRVIEEQWPCYPMNMHSVWRYVVAPWGDVYLA